MRGGGGAIHLFTKSEIFQAFISWNFDDYSLQIMKTQNSVSQKIFILHKINKKVYFLTEMSGFWKVGSFLCTQYLVGPPFAWITASMWREHNQPVALLRCNEAQVALIAAFRPSALLGLVSLIFLLTIEVQVRQVCWPFKHSNTMVIEPAFGTFGSVDRCQVLLENEISISIKLVSRRKHEVL